VFDRAAELLRRDCWYRVPDPITDNIDRGLRFYAILYVTRGTAECSGVFRRECVADLITKGIGMSNEIAGFIMIIL